MKKMFGIFLLVAIVAFSGVLGFYLVTLIPVKQHIQYAENIANIQNLQTLEASWSLATLHTYSSPESNFDQVAGFLPRIRELRNTLSNSELAKGNVPETLNNKLIRFLLLIEGKEGAIEHFKSNFAVMRNSIKFLPLASRTLTVKLRKIGDKKRIERISDLYDRTNIFLQKPDEGTQARLMIELSKMDDLVMELKEDVANPLANFISHARVLVERKIQLNESINNVIDQQANQVGDELIELYKTYSADLHEEQSSKQFMNYLFAVIAALFLAIAAIVGATKLWRQSREFDEKLNQGIAEKTEAYEQAESEASGSMVDQNLDKSMAGMGRMVATVAHEINTPLGYLGSNLQVLHNGMDKMQTLMGEFSTLQRDLNGISDSGQVSSRIQNFTTLIQNTQDEAMLDELPEIVDDMQGGIDQIRHVIDDLRDFSRKDRSSQDWFDIKQCAESVLKMAQKDISPNIKVQTDFADVPEVYGSPGELNQVFINLINNAAHAIETAIEAGNCKNGLIKIKTSFEKGQIMVSIMDNGSGIDEETRRRIFEPFFTTKDVGKGTGLGLAIVRRIITKHDGKVLVKSIPGKGTNFIFALPVKVKTQELSSTLE